MKYDLYSERADGRRVRLRLYTGNEERAGPLILYLHGMCGCADNWAYQTAYERRAWASFDMFGCGDSEQAHQFFNFSSTHPYAPPALRQDIEAVWRQTTRDGERPCVVVAHSYSTSLVTQWLAERSPRNIVGVVLVGTHASTPPKANADSVRLLRRLPMLLQQVGVRTAMGPLRWYNLLLEHEHYAHGSLGSAVSDAARHRWLWWEEHKPAWLYANLVCTLEWARPADFTRAYSERALYVCWGRDDPLTPPDARVSALARSTLIEEGRAHWPMLDSPQFDGWLDAALQGTAVRMDAIIASCAISSELSLTCERGTARRCAMCGRPAALGCARCAVAYCDARCQRVHWKLTHRRTCK